MSLCNISCKSEENNSANSLGSLRSRNIWSAEKQITKVRWSLENPFYSQHVDYFRSPEFSNSINFCLLLERLRRGKLVLSLNKIGDNSYFWTDIEVSLSILRRDYDSENEEECYKKTAFMCRSATSIAVQFDASDFRESGEYVVLGCKLKWPTEDCSVTCEKLTVDDVPAKPSKDDSQEKHKIIADEGELRDNFNRLFENQKFSDFVVLVKDQKFNVHRAVLGARSPVFAAMLEHETKENEDSSMVIDDFKPEVIAELFRYMYTSQTSELELTTILDLYEAADKYQLLSFKLKCSELLSVKMTSDIALDALVKACMHEDENLKAAAIERILSSENITESEEWLEFLRRYPESANCVVRRCIDETRGNAAKRVKSIP